MAPSVAASGITTDNSTGERHIPSSTRADGSQRREIRVRPGYRPPEDVELYKNRAAAAFRNRGVTSGGGVPGAEGLKSDESSATAEAAAAGAASNKNAKKREAKRRAKEGAAAASSEEVKTGQEPEPEPEPDSSYSPSKQAGAQGKENWRPGGTTNGGGDTAAADSSSTVDPEIEKEKKARNLKKKLRQARDLRDKKDKGENLLPEQLEKVIKMQELIRQLDALGLDAEGEKKEHQEQPGATAGSAITNGKTGGKSAGL